MTQEDITVAVQEAVRAELKKFFAAHDPCRIPISDEVAKQIPHLTGMIADLDEDGDFDKGIEILRADHNWLLRRRTVFDDDYAANHRFISRLRAKLDSAATKVIEWLLIAGIALLVGWTAKGIIASIIEATKNGPK